MTPESRALVRESWNAVGGKEEALAWAFYSDLFERAPHAVKLFAHVTMQAQRVRFSKMLTHIVGALDAGPALESDLRALAARHVGYGVVAADYGYAGESLIRAFQVVLGPTFTPGMRTAWEDLYRLVARTMVAVHRADPA